jgi:hypothetical protein
MKTMLHRPLFAAALACAGSLTLFTLQAAPAAAPLDYKFDGKISQEVLENYLEHSISFTELLHDDLNKRNRSGVDPKDNIRMLLNIKAKFIGRALMCWTRERELPTLLANAKPFIELMHQSDPDIVFQGAAFEIVGQGVEGIAIPPYVFQEFGQPVTNRNFRMADIIYTTPGHQFGNRVPDMSRLEARMWFYYLCTQYIDVGIEGIHFGQVGLMDENDRRDKKHEAWRDVLGRIRANAKQHARRHFVICDAHTPTGGYVEDGQLLFDAHAFPLRITEVAGQPFKGVLQVGYADSLFTKSKGGVTPSGWSCEHLPFLVEFDNFGGSGQGRPSRAPFIWGWDEITWIAVLPEAERNDWIRYAFIWIKEHDPVAHLEMPGSRVITPGAAGGSIGRWYWANNRSEACPNGWGTEETIKSIWSGDPPAAK